MKKKQNTAIQRMVADFRAIGKQLRTLAATAEDTLAKPAEITRAWNNGLDLLIELPDTFSEDLNQLDSEIARKVRAALSVLASSARSIKAKDSDTGSLLAFDKDPKTEILAIERLANQVELMAA